jgi:hypothetical protein
MKRYDWKNLLKMVENNQNKNGGKYKINVVSDGLDIYTEHWESAEFLGQIIVHNILDILYVEHQYKTCNLST